MVLNGNSGMPAKSSQRKKKTIRSKISSFKLRKNKYKLFNGPGRTYPNKQIEIFAFELDIIFQAAMKYYEAYIYLPFDDSRSGIAQLYSNIRAALSLTIDNPFPDIIASQKIMAEHCAENFKTSEFEDDFYQAFNHYFVMLILNFHSLDILASLDLRLVSHECATNTIDDAFSEQFGTFFLQEFDFAFEAEILLKIAAMFQQNKQYKAAIRCALAVRDENSLSKAELILGQCLCAILNLRTLDSEFKGKISTVRRFMSDNNYLAATESVQQAIESLKPYQLRLNGLNETKAKPAFNSAHLFMPLNYEAHIFALEQLIQKDAHNVVAVVCRKLAGIKSNNVIEDKNLAQKTAAGQIIISVENLVCIVPKLSKDEQKCFAEKVFAWANACFQAGVYESALTCYEISSRFDVNLPVLNNLAITHAMLQDFAAAKQCFDSAQSQYSDVDELNNNKKLIVVQAREFFKSKAAEAEEKKNYKEAIDFYQQATFLDCADEDIFKKLQTCRIEFAIRQIGNADYPHAKQNLDKVMLATPDNLRAKKMLINVLLQLAKSVRKISSAECVQYCETALLYCCQMAMLASEKLDKEIEDYYLNAITLMRAAFVATREKITSLNALVAAGESKQLPSNKLDELVAAYILLPDGFWQAAEINAALQNINSDLVARAWTQKAMDATSTISEFLNKPDWLNKQDENVYCDIWFDTFKKFYEKAINNCLSLLNSYPKLPGMSQCLSSALYGYYQQLPVESTEQQLEQAIDYYHKVLRHVGHPPLAKKTLLQRLLAAGSKCKNFVGAKKLYSHGLLIDKDDAGLNAAISDLYHQQAQNTKKSDINMAINYLDKAYEHNPSLKNDSVFQARYARYTIIMVGNLLKTTQTNYDDAIQQIKTALPISGNTDKLMQLWKVAHYRQGVTFVDAIKKNKTNVIPQCTKALEQFELLYNVDSKFSLPRTYKVDKMEEKLRDVMLCLQLARCNTLCAKFQPKTDDDEQLQILYKFYNNAVMYYAKVFIKNFDNDVIAQEYAQTMTDFMRQADTASTAGIQRLIIGTVDTKCTYFLSKRPGDEVVKAVLAAANKLLNELNSDSRYSMGVARPFVSKTNTNTNTKKSSNGLLPKITNDKNLKRHSTVKTPLTQLSIFQPEVQSRKQKTNKKNKKEKTTKTDGNVTWTPRVDIEEGELGYRRGMTRHPQARKI